MRNDNRDPRVRSKTRYWLDCTICGPDAEPTPPRFPSEAALWRNLLSPWNDGWVRLDDGRILCPAHRRSAHCDATGHELTPWTEHPADDGLEWRYCACCGGRFEQRTTARCSRLDR